MENLEMHENNFDVPLSPSTEDNNILEKRQKLNTDNLVSFDCSTRNSDVCLTKKILTFHTNLSQADASGVQFCEMRPMIEESFEEEEGNSELAVCSEFDMSQTNNRTKDIFRNSSIEHVEMIPSSFEYTQKLMNIHDKRMEVELDHTLGEDRVPQEMDLQNTELDVVVMEILKFNSERVQWEEKQPLPHASELGGQFQSDNSIISTFSAAVREEDKNASELMGRLQGQCEEISPGDHTFESRETGDLSSFPVNIGDDILEKQEIMNKQSGEELDSILNATRNSSKTKENFEIRCKNIELLNENSRLMKRMMQQAAQDQVKLDEAEKNIIELKEKLKSMSALRRDMALQKIELIEANIRIEELTSQRTERLNSLEEDLRSQKAAVGHQERDVIPTPLCEYLESMKQRVTFLESKCERLTLKVREYESMKRRGKPTTPSEECKYLIEKNEDMKAQLEDSKSERGGLEEARSSERSRLVKYGKFNILVSDARYFEIDWKKHRESREGCRYSCRECPKKFNNSPDFRDHLWSQHYGGRFKCPHCRDCVHEFKWRKNFINHMKIEHGNGCNARKD